MTSFTKRKEFFKAWLRAKRTAERDERLAAIYMTKRGGDSREFTALAKSGRATAKAQNRFERLKKLMWHG